MSASSSSSRIVLGVSGSIAAFKAAQLASDMVKAGLDVRAILTSAAARFVSPLTFQALTGNAVGTEIWDENLGERRMGHLELARWADALVIAPASADLLARLALGLADDLLTSVALACRAPLVIAPAMETAMWEHSATQSHVDILRDRGTQLVGPETGRLASGAEGAGRMSEPETILTALRSLLNTQKELRGRRVLVTAGPTYEPIDPVRFIGNRSSGKMGYAIAEEARDRGAEVVLLTGPASLPSPYGMEIRHVETTGEMRQAVLDRVADCQVVIMAAAIADFRPSVNAQQKLKRREAVHLELVPTPDIAAEAAAANPRALHVGFALESSNLLDAARDKLRRKSQNMVVANAISTDHNPFGSETNHVWLVTEEETLEIPPMSKREVARVLWDEIAKML